MMNVSIRLEHKSDFRRVEEITRDAFWNLYVPGADEHFLLHTLRKSSSFIKELDFVAVVDDVVVGNIAYSLSVIKDGHGNDHKTITFGPVSVSPSLQGKGIGSMLIRHSIDIAREMGFPAIIIYGYPNYYQRFGFENGKQFGISASDGRFMKALLVLELQRNALKGTSGRFFADELFDVDKDACEAFEKTFSHKEKAVTDTQKQFELMANALA